MTFDGEEAERQRLQRALDAERTAGERNAMGQFATAPALADAVVRRCVTPFAASLGRPLRVLEPSLGSGALVSALLRELGADRIERVHGVERDSRFANAARALWASAAIDVVHADYTRLRASRTPRRRGVFDVVLANPPYVRHHHLSIGEKARLRARVHAELGMRVSGLAGLYVYFVLLADAWMDDDALGVWLIPSEWMDVGYGAALREYLSTRVSLLGVHRFESRDVQFADALVSSSVVWFRRARPASDAMCVVSSGADLEAPTTSRDVAVGALASQDKWSTSFTSAPRPTRRESPRVRLGDLCRVTRGVATGANGFFVRPRAVFHSLGVSDAFLRPVLPSSRLVTSRVIETTDDGWPRCSSELALLDCDLPEAEVRARHPQLWRYLQSDVGKRVRAGYLCSRRAPWYAQEKRPLAPIVATYMGRGRAGASPFRFVWNRSRATATNVWLLLSPTETLAAEVARRPEIWANLVDALSSIDRDVLVAQGRVYGGGLHKLEPKELAALDVTELAASIGIAPAR